MSFRVLSVGNCAFDHGQIEQLLAPTGAHLEALGSAEQTLAAVDDTCRLVLVNRIIDQTGESGLELLRTLRDRHPSVAVMLISNYADAQREAQEAGALEGFGKSQLGDPQLVQRLAELLSVELAP